MAKPIIAVTMGDPAGIGPELVVKVLSQGWVWDTCRPFVVGEPAVMTDICQVLGSTLQFRTMGSISEAVFSPGTIDILCPEDLGLDMGQLTRGTMDPTMGRAAALCLTTAFQLALQQKVDGVVAAPMNKEAFHLAGYDYQDELAYLAELTDSSNCFMVGAMEWVWTVPVTEHIAFREIADLITKERVLGYIKNLHSILKKVKGPIPRLAVAALNVHGGEGGLFGYEEIKEIGPAVLEARDQGIDVQGPLPADTIFVRAREEGLDGVVCMYHDQANIVRKLEGSRRGATLFIGLPVACGTTAHGTAFDKAGKGIADPGSLADALRYTVSLSTN
jgi:4-hydroxy-L-threonine phosphate dehydrogenase PdxA